MKKLLVMAVPLMGFVLAKGEAIVMKQKTEMVEIIKVDPRKNYRTKQAQQYFGSRGNKCRKWGRFCRR